MKEETSAHQAYAAVELQRLTLEDVIAKRVAGESGKLIERVRSVEGVVQAALSASLVNSLADHASEVSDPIQAIHLLLEGVNKARDVEDTGEAIVERLLGAAYCLAQTPKAKAAFENDEGFELLSEPLDELLGDERESMRADATKRTFALKFRVFRRCGASRWRRPRVHHQRKLRHRSRPPFWAATSWRSRRGGLRRGAGAGAGLSCPNDLPGARRDEARAPDLSMMDEPPKGLSRFPHPWCPAGAYATPLRRGREKIHKRGPYAIDPRSSTSSTYRTPNSVFDDSVPAESRSTCTRA